MTGSAARKLILLRHAKSAWDDPALPDEERPLNRRGHRAAPATGRWLAARGHLPDRIVCSPARRTRETVERIRQAVAGLPAPVIEPGLYLAEADRMLAIAAALPEGCAAAMLVGHEPGMSALARLLSDGREAPGCARAFAKFPTAAAAVFEFDGAWPDLAPGAATFTAFALPRELETG